MKRLALCLLLALVALSGLAAQSNVTIDRVLAERSVSWANAAWLVLNASQAIPEEADPLKAAQTAKSRGFAVPANPERVPVTLGDYSFLIVKELGLKVGIIYSIIPSGHYALRELVYAKAITPPAWENQTLSGEEAMRILLKAMDIKEKQK